MSRAFLALRSQSSRLQSTAADSAESIDFERLAQSPIKLFVTATNVRTGRGRVFRNAEMTPDVLLASACLPTMFQAVEIDGEHYWDGGYSGNPTITPLVRECTSQGHHSGPDQSASSAPARRKPLATSSIASTRFPSMLSLMKELRMIALLRQIADPGDSEGALWAGMRIHRIASDMMVDLGYSSKLNAEWDFLCMLRDAGRRAAEFVSRHTRRGFRPALLLRSRRAAEERVTPWGCSASCSASGCSSGWRIGAGASCCSRPAAALIAAAFAGGPLLAYWTQTFMDSAARFVAQFFPVVPAWRPVRQADGRQRLGAAIADFMTEHLGPRRAILTVVLAGALVTYGGVSLFVAFFVLAPMAQALFRAAGIPNRLMPAAIALGTSTFTMSALPGTPAIQNAIPMPFFGTTPFAAPGLGIIASAIMLAFGLWWLGRAEAAARRKGRRLWRRAHRRPLDAAAEDEIVRERATTAREFDPAEVHHGRLAREIAADRPGGVAASSWLSASMC